MFQLFSLEHSFWALVEEVSILLCSAMYDNSLLDYTIDPRHTCAARDMVLGWAQGCSALTFRLLSLLACWNFKIMGRSNVYVYFCGLVAVDFSTNPEAIQHSMFAKKTQTPTKHRHSLSTASYQYFLQLHRLSSLQPVPQASRKTRSLPTSHSFQ